MVKRAFWYGLSIVVVLGISKYLGDAAFSLWQPFINQYLELIPSILQWGLGIVLTILSILALGFVVIITKFAQKLIQRFRAKRLQKNHQPEDSEKDEEEQSPNLVQKLVQKLIQFLWTKKLQKNHFPVALVEYGGDQFLCAILENHEDDYKVVVINPPAPISGQILFVKRDQLQFTDLTITDLLRQITSFGFIPIFPKLGRLKKNNKHLHE